MEVGLLPESSDITKKFIPASKSSILPAISNVDELVLGKQVTSKCEHFTIRGFVSEVCKRDAEICWPFSTHRKQKSERGHVNKLPPLTVKKFRRWSCQTCLNEAIHSEAAIPNGTAMTSQIDAVKNDAVLPQKRKNDIAALLGDTCKVSHCEVTKSFLDAIRMSHAKCFLLSSSAGNNGKTSLTSILFKEGGDRSKEAHNLMNKSTSVAVGKEACQIGEKGQRNVILGTTSDVAFLGKSTDKSGTSDKFQGQRHIKLGQRMDSGRHEAEESAMPQKADTLPSTSVFYGSKDLVICGDRASDTSIPLIENKPNPRKARKVRFLDDIIRSDNQQKTNICVSSGDAVSNGSSSTPEQDDEHPPSLKRKDELLSSSKTKKDEHPNQGALITQDTEEVVVKRKKRKESLPGNGDGACLIHWLKKAPKSAGLSKVATVKDIDLNLECSGRKENKQEIIGEKRGKCEVMRCSFVPKKDVTTKKGHIIIQDLLIKDSPLESAGIMISENYRQSKVETEGNIHTKKQLGFNKKKRPLVEDGGSNQLHRLKDSSIMKDQSGIQVHKQSKKKRRTMRKSEQVAADDIPMDIVELLAKKQQERHLMNIKDIRDITQLPEVTTSTKDGGNCNIAGFSSWTSDRNNGNAECRPKAYPSGNRVTEYHDIDLNQEAPISGPSDLQECPQYIGRSMSGAQLSNFHSNNSNNCQQNISANGTKMIAFSSDQMYRVVSSQKLFSNAHDGSDVIWNGYPSGINVEKVHSDFSSNNIFLGKNPTLINTTNDKAESSANQGIFPNMKGPVEMHSNETMSVSNLLRFMQQSAHSVEPCSSPVHNDPNGYFRAYNGYNCEYPWLARGSNYELNQQESHLSKPLRPLPRMGVLGPLLQNEITNTSKSSTPTLGFGSGNSNIPFQRVSFVPRDSNELAFPLSFKERAESSSPATVPNVVTPKKSFERIGSSSVGLVMARSRDGAFQPIRTTEKLGQCIVNRNPADFAIPDENSEYMIRYQETETRDMPYFRSLQHQTHQQSQKAKKVRKINDLKRSTTSKYLRE